MIEREITLEELRCALHFIPADSRETWVQVGMGIKDHFGPDGWDAWDTWSQSGTGYNLQDAKAVWRSFRKGGVGIGTVVKLAMDNGWKPEQKELSAEDKRRFAREQGPGASSARPRWRPMRRSWRRCAVRWRPSAR